MQYSCCTVLLRTAYNKIMNDFKHYKFTKKKVYLILLIHCRIFSIFSHPWTLREVGETCRVFHLAYYSIFPAGIRSEI